jgi:hypothetical protein
MATNEQISELSSLGISAKRRDERDTKEVADLIEILKSVLYEEYKSTYEEKNH